MANEIRGNKIKDMIIYLTSNCNLKCTHCYVPKEKTLKELSIDDLNWIRNTFDIKNVNLMGGEPFLYPHLEDAIDIFKNVTITTNGLFLASDNPNVDRWIKFFKKKKEIGNDGKEVKTLSIQLSIEGNQIETDAVRGPGVWDKVLDTARLLKKNDISCYFRCSYHEGNLQSIPWLIDNLAHPLDIPLILFPQIGMSPLTPDQQIWLFNLLLEKNTKYKSHNLIAQPHFMQWLGEKGRCEAGSERLCITYSKDIIPCHFDFDYVLGSIGNSLDVINKNREMYLNAAKRIQPSCEFCNHADICRSGCYMSDSHAGCPLKNRFTKEVYMNMHNTNTESMSIQVKEMKGLIKGSLIC